MRNCPRCHTIKPFSEFYQRRGKPGSSVYCKPCHISQALERQRALKAECVIYKGGKCVSCGYNKCNAALEFHHLDPSQKEFSMNHQKGTTFNDKIRKELDKCSLLCSNCHREVHNI